MDIRHGLCKPIQRIRCSMTTLYPQPGIIVCYTRIPVIVDLVFCTPPDPNFKTMPPLSFRAADFKITFLSADELRIVNGFKALKKQIEWICGRFALKQLVQKNLAQDIVLDEIQVSYQEKGAPFLNDYPDTPISLSHSGDYTAVTLSQNNEITMGIDIEQIRKMPDSFFMNTAFTAKEIRHMIPTPHEMYRHWTLKEAFLKYIKMGFNEPLHMVEIINNEIFHHKKKQRLNLWSETINDQYILSMVADPL